MLEDHFSKLSRWIQLESKAEADRLLERQRRASKQNAESTGESLIDLNIRDTSTGLAGRTLLTFGKANHELALPWNRLRVGTPVVISATDPPQGPALQGIVSARRQDTIQIATSHRPDGRRFRIDLAPDEQTRRRQMAAIQEVANATGRLGTLRKIFMGQRPPKFQPIRDCEFFSPQLDDSQRAAVAFALSASDLAVVHGPPGTGKTTTVVEFIRQTVAREESVLACAPSNTATDHLLKKLAAAGLKVVRLGHPARVAEELRHHALDLQVESHENTKIAKEMLQEADNLFRQADRFTRARPARNAKQDLRREAKRLLRDAKLLKKQASHQIIDGCDVVCATTALHSDLLGDRMFDWAVVDEACQSTEPGTWVPLLNAYRVLLAGDHCQLPPTVVSQTAAQEGFAVSLLERAVSHYGDHITRLLMRQYRMHETIMQFSSQQFYDGKVIADPSVAHHTLAELLAESSESDLASPAKFIDTAGTGWDEEMEPDGESRRNPSEAQFVWAKAKQLLERGLPGKDLAIIAPYAGQVRLLRSLGERHRQVEIDTVDGFQGREKEVILISLVRSNTMGEIGFLADRRRMNVALTRARRKLIVVGNSATLGSHPFYSAMLEYFENHDAYGTIWEDPLAGL